MAEEKSTKKDKKYSNKKTSSETPKSTDKKMSEKKVEGKKPAAEKSKPAAKKQGFNHKKVLGPVIAVILVLVLIVALSTRSGGGSASIGDASLSNIKTYLSKSTTDPDKQAQSDFKLGDPIQVGFTYDSESENNLVSFNVKDDSGDSVFKTNLFRLTPGGEELFVSINNTSLPAGDYTVELVSNEDEVVHTAEFSLSE